MRMRIGRSVGDRLAKGLLGLAPPLVAASQGARKLSLREVLVTRQAFRELLLEP